MAVAKSGGGTSWEREKLGPDPTSSGTRLFSLAGKGCRKGSAGERGWCEEEGGEEGGDPGAGSRGKGAEVGAGPLRSAESPPPARTPPVWKVPALPKPRLPLFVSCRLMDSLEIKFYFSQQTRPRCTSCPQRTQVTLGPIRDANPSSGAPQHFQPPDPNPLSRTPRPLPRPSPTPGGGSGQPGRGPRCSRSQSPPVGTAFLSSALK